MLTILGSPPRVCNNHTRREVLQAAGLGLFGLSLPKMLAAENTASATTPFRNGPAKSVLFLLLFGGPSQLETFDMKPEAPDSIRGPFRPIASRTPGLIVSEHLPRVAKLTDKFALVRSLNHPYNDHGAVHYIQTGHPHPARFGPTPDETAVSPEEWPAMGSVVEFLTQRYNGQSRKLPDYVYLPNRLGALQGIDRVGQYAGWLGRGYDALATSIEKRNSEDNPFFRTCTDEELDFRLKGLASRAEMRLDRFTRRRTLLQQFEDVQRSLDANAPVEAFGKIRRRALELATSEEIRTALDIRRESQKVRDRYGHHLFGQSVLMGRRLIEAGSRFVTVAWDAPDGYSWDSHRNSHDLQKFLLPGFDQTYSALLIDLEERGLLDETLVVAVGEMGRDPKGNSNWGRGHWTHCFHALLAGAGIRGGTIYGRSDKYAAYPTENPTSPEDLAATIYKAFGLDPHMPFTERDGRPIPLMDKGKALTELFG